MGDGFTQKGGEMGGGYQCESGGGKEKGSTGRWDAQTKNPARTVRN